MSHKSDNCHTKNHVTSDTICTTCSDNCSFVKRGGRRLLVFTNFLILRTDEPSTTPFIKSIARISSYVCISMEALIKSL